MPRECPARKAGHLTILGTQGTITSMSIESKVSGGVIKYRGVPQVRGQKRHTAWVKTRAEASMLEAELRMSMGGQVPKSGHTVGAVVAGYIEACIGDDRSPATIAYYRHGEASIPTAFAERLVSEVNSVILDGVYREMRRAGASNHSTKRLHSTLSAAFSRAVKYGWLATNPCKSVSAPRVKAEEISPPTTAEVNRIITAAAKVNADLSACLRLGAASGMRRSELVALQWRDLSGEQLTIRRNRVKDGKAWVTRDTKTGTRGHRTIHIDKGTAAALEEVRARQLADGHECVWMFTHDGLEPFQPQYLTRSYALLAKDGADGHLHGLRHFHATQLLSQGVPVTQVSHRLGHASPLQTMTTYAHWIPANDQTSADLIGSLLD